MKWPTFTQPSPNLNYNFSYRPSEIWPVRVLISIGILFMLIFLWVYFQPENQGHPLLFGLLTASVLFRLLRLAHEWYHYWNVVPPTRPQTTRFWSVDVLTTYCPGEPLEMVINTLRAIEGIAYPHTTYLCDEANDQHLKQICSEMGVIHVTRTDKTDAKAGNINNALQQATGEICLVIDPDHVPVPDFLDKVLPYFERDDVGFVQCVQGYYNRKESVVAFGAAEQTYSFYGPMMTCMGQYGTAQAIGANCTFRRAALDSIGGHANGLSEDMHTAMKLHAEGWQSVYVPLPLSYGLVPATLSAYYKQQLKWSRGTFELLVTTLPMVFSQLSWRQKLHYTTLPLYYLLGVIQLFDWLIPIISLMTMLLPLQLDLLRFAAVYMPLVLTGFLIRQYAQRWLIEDHEAGFHLVGGILASGTWWVYLLGLLYTIFRVRVPYIPTPKDDRPRNHLWLTVPNLLVALVSLFAIGYGVYYYGRFAFHNVYFRMMIGFATLNILILGLTVVAGQELLFQRLAVWFTKPSDWVEHVWQLRRTAWNLRYGLYFWLRRQAVPLFAALVFASVGLILFAYRFKTDALPTDLRYANTQPFYVGLSNDAISLRSRFSAPMQPIIPYHVNWPILKNGSLTLIKSGYTNELPLLYLEPRELYNQPESVHRAFFKRILNGEYDATLATFVENVNRNGQPVLSSFMPEFDAPGRPWYINEESSLRLYRQAWQYLVDFCRKQASVPIVWVWCPTQPASLANQYPGGNYVDWLGIPVLNEPETAGDSKHHSFAALYQLPHITIRVHPTYSIRTKPVLITRLESKEDSATNQRWTAEALDLIQERYPSIRGIVFTSKAGLQVLPTHWPVEKTASGH